MLLSLNEAAMLLSCNYYCMNESADRLWLLPGNPGTLLVSRAALSRKVTQPGLRLLQLLEFYGVRISLMIGEMLTTHAVNCVA